MSILLISVQNNMEVIGLKYLHYMLLSHAIDSTLLFLPRLDEAGRAVNGPLGEFISERRPLMIGISLMSTEFHSAAELTGYLKSSFPDIPVVWGGIHPTISPEQCLEHADYVCVGEGEGTVLDMARAIGAGHDLRGINNICYKTESGVVRNPLYPLIMDLDSLPHCDHVPRNSYVLDAGGIIQIDNAIYKKYDRYYGSIYNIMSSRGCPFSCTYCCNNFINQLYHSHRVRRRGVENIISELQQAVAMNPGIKQVNFQDDCFLSFSETFLGEFCALYRGKVGKPFIIRSIPVYLTRNKLQLLKEAGVAWISIGLQSGSDRVNRDVYKRRSLKSDFLQAARMIREFNIAAMYDVILDNPFESEEDKIETIETLIETPKPFYPQFFSLTLYLGTEIHEMARHKDKTSADEYLEKPYYVYTNTALNDMTRSAVYLPARMMRQFVAWYRSNPHSLRFRLAWYGARLLVLMNEPISYLRVINLSQGGNLLRTVMILPSYFREGVRRFLWQFGGASHGRSPEK